MSEIIKYRDYVIRVEGPRAFRVMSPKGISIGVGEHQQAAETIVDELITRREALGVPAPAATEEARVIGVDPAGVVVEEIVQSDSTEVAIHEAHAIATPADIDPEVVETTATKVPETDTNVPLPMIALTTSELAETQKGLRAWCDLKIKAVKKELKELREHYNYAKAHRWAVKGWDDQLSKTQESQTFYEKVKAALEAGYLIVPNLPINVFAVRNSDRKPEGNTLYNPGNRMYVPDIPAQVLAEGEGRYVDPQPQLDRRKMKAWHGGELERTKNWYLVPSARDPQFPLTMAQPRVIDATKEALALKIFDEVGMVGQPREVKTLPPPSADPIVVGRIRHPEGRYLTFFIAHWIEWEML